MAMEMKPYSAIVLEVNLKRFTFHGLVTQSLYAETTLSEIITGHESYGLQFRPPNSLRCHARDLAKSKNKHIVIATVARKTLFTSCTLRAKEAETSRNCVLKKINRFFFFTAFYKTGVTRF